MLVALLEVVVVVVDSVVVLDPELETTGADVAVLVSDTAGAGVVSIVGSGLGLTMITGAS